MTMQATHKEPSLEEIIEVVRAHNGDVEFDFADRRHPEFEICVKKYPRGYQRAHFYGSTIQEAYELFTQSEYYRGNK